MATTLTEPRPTEPPKQAIELARSYGTPPIFAHGPTGALIYERFYEQVTSEWCEAVYSSAAKSLSEDPVLQDIPKWIRVLQGEHWLAGRPSYRATPVVNRVLRYWLELQSIISDVRLNTYVHSENPAYKDIAGKLTKLSASNWQDQDGDMKLMATVQHSSLGIGFTKVGINPKEMDVTFLPSGSDSTIPIMPSANDFQESGGVIYKSWKPISWFWNKYSILARQVKPEASGWHRSYPARPYYIAEYTWNNMNPGFRAFFAETEGSKGRGVDEYGRVPMAMHQEFWFHDDRINTSMETLTVGYGNFTYLVKPGELVYPYGRLICTAGEHQRVVLYDGPNFHWHAMFPFAVLRLRPVVWLFTGLSLFQDLFPINCAINQLLADFQDYLKQILNPTLVVRDRAMSPDAYEEYFPGMPGAKIRIMNINEPLANIFRFERPETGGMGIIPNAVQLLLRLFDEQAGLIDAGQLMGKKQVPSGETVEQIQNIRQSLFRMMASFVVKHMRQIGTMQISDMLQFYNRKKVVAHLGVDGVTWQNFDWDPDTYVQYTQGKEPFRRGREFVKNFRHMVAAGTALPAQRQSQANIAMALNARSRLSTKTLFTFLESTGFPSPDFEQEVTQILKESQELPQPNPPKGGSTPK